MPKTFTPSIASKSQTPAPALISLDDLYAAPVPVTCTLDTAKGPYEIIMQVQKDRVTADFMLRLLNEAEKIKDTAIEDEDMAELLAMKFEIDSAIPWITETVVSWNLDFPPTVENARSLGLKVLKQLANAIQLASNTNQNDPEHPNE